jgi:hypothetical protein
MEKVVLSIGLNDKDTKKQILTVVNAKKIIEDACLKLTDGATIYDANGIYKHDDGRKVSEKIIRVELYNANIERVKALCAILKKSLNQEAIAVERQKIDSEFF